MFATQERDSKPFPGTAGPKTRAPTVKHLLAAYSDTCMLHALLKYCQLLLLIQLHVTAADTAGGPGVADERHAYRQAMIVTCAFACKACLKLLQCAVLHLSVTQNYSMNLKMYELELM